ncbi:sensor histidine kinase [Novosphingobium humi]|uniref:histidine kinase n=1 Tax=Novosphingobium humi TaxID=2282397 RepID=A0ABY7U416_9SPHN|nr:HAMP domain-containing sensor histidine kinase [Novosphingobium humi]WCT80240.1 HAMP domain-containing sensor histidine kinase [Novosphingobium humi]
MMPGFRFKTLAGKLTFILAAGSSIACALALWGAEEYRRRGIEAVQYASLVASGDDLTSRFARDEDKTARDLMQGRIFGARFLVRPPSRAQYDANLTGYLQQRLPASAAPIAFHGAVEDCIGDYRAVQASGARGFFKDLPECWLVIMRAPSGRLFTIGLPVPSVGHSAGLAFAPTALAITTLASLLIAAFVARMTLDFMRRLQDATRRFAEDINAPPITDHAPRDVRATYDAFNAMQQRIRTMMLERNDMLAAISHDLQTPLTRLRLRAEAMPASVEQTKIIADVAAMERMVRDGLALAQSRESSDDWAWLDIDSLLTSIVEDLREEGKVADLGRIDKICVRVKPSALARCLQNLADNAIRYGWAALFECIDSDGIVRIRIADKGPGIPDADLERMFLPFVRGEFSRSRQTGGTGIGLTIARAQAATFGAQVALANTRDGLTATVTLKGDVAANG